MNPVNRKSISVVLSLLLALGVAAPLQAGNVRSRSNTNVNVNKNVNKNVNIDRDRNVNVNRHVDRDVDIDVDVDRHGGCCYHDHHDHHPIATAAAVTATAVVTAAVVGSIVYSIPPSCSTVIVNGFAYQQCGSTWYQPQFVGTTTSYVVVAAPR